MILFHRMYNKAVTSAKEKASLLALQGMRTNLRICFQVLKPRKQWMFSWIILMAILYKSCCKEAVNLV